MLNSNDETITVKFGNSIRTINAQSGNLKTEFGNHSGLSTIQITADDKYVMTGTWRGHGVYVWDMETGELVKKLLEDVKSAKPSTNPIDPNEFVTNGDRLKFWESNDLQLLDGANEVEFSSASCTYSNDGSLLAAKTTSYELQLVDSVSKKHIGTLGSRSQARMLGFTFSPDDSRLAIACFDNLQVWDLKQVREQLQEIGLDW